MDYLTRWEETTHIKDCTTVTKTKFLFENVVTGFGFPKILVSDQGTHFVNQLIEELTDEFQIHHSRTTPYHSQANGVLEEFNKILENALTKVSNGRRDDWDHNVSIVLWTYRTTCKNLTGQTPFKLVYGQEDVMPMEYIVPSLRVVAIMEMENVDVVEERFLQLIHLEKERFVAGFHQNIENQR